MTSTSGYQPGRAVGITASMADYRELGASYAISLPVFEGPLDLLLHLIEQEQLDISEVSLVAVTDQYLRAIEQMAPPLPGALADFMVVASRLLYIKSAHLLPKPLSADEDDEDAGETLVRHLLEYRQFKRVADALRTREDGLRAFARPPGTVELPDAQPREVDVLDVGILHAALRKALARIVTTPPPPSVHPYPVTVAERMEGVRRRFANLRAAGQAQVSFASLLAEAESRMAIIVTFLAVLELVKQRELRAEQDDTFGDIRLTVAEEDADAPLAATSDDEEGGPEETGAGEAEDAEQE